MGGKGALGCSVLVDGMFFCKNKYILNALTVCRTKVKNTLLA